MNLRRALKASAAPLWIDEARDHLKIAGKHEPGLNVMIPRGEVFPYTHDIGLLLDRAARIGEAIPDEVRKGEALTLYSGGGRYPNTADERAETTREEYEGAMVAAAAVIGWAARRVEALVSKADETGTDIRHPQASATADGGTDPA